MIDTIRESLLVLDADLRILRANHAFYDTFHVTRSETEGRLLYELGDGQWKIAALQRLLEQVLPEKSEVHDFEVRHEFPAIGWRCMLLNARRIEGPGEPVATILLAIEDVTGRKRAEEEAVRRDRELERSNAELERFAYVASHDLQEPLRIISSFTQLLARRYRGHLDAEADEFIEFIVDAAQRMRALINNLLAYSRLSSRAHECEMVDCERIFEQASQNLLTAVQESHAVVTHDVLPTVRADVDQLGQVFQNLLANAIKFHGPQPPRIHVWSRRVDREWVFGVRDNGIGLDPQYADDIFVLFRRLHGPGQYGGSGVGLAICKRVVERHGGRMWVESSPGNGATFFFTLPVTPD